MHEFSKLTNKRSRRGIAFRLMSFSSEFAFAFDINMFTYAASIETLSAVRFSCCLFRNYADISSERPKNFFLGGTRILVLQDFDDD